MQAVRVLTEVVGSVALAARLTELTGIKFFMPTAEITDTQSFLRLVAFGVGKRMPSPVAHRAQRHPFRIGLWKCLQPRGIDGKGEMAVTHSQRTQGIHSGQMRIVTAHHRLAVNGSCIHTNIQCQSQQ